MPRRPAALLLALALATPALAQEGSVSAEIGARGLRATEARLAARPDPTPSDLFALGGVRFLAGIERALQLRYDVGLAGGLAEATGLPILRLPIPENPTPEPFAAPMIDQLFDGVEQDMGGAVDALSRIGDEDDVGVEVDLADLWFDIDSDGRRSRGEGLLEIAGWMLSGGFDQEIGSATIRFDTADSAWLMAYAHLLAGTSEAVLAFDPTDAVARVMAARARFAELGLPAPSYDFFGDMGQWSDVAALFVMAVEGQPDPAHVRAARDHLLATVEQNRRFWRLVPKETDNDREWIPNKNQQSATGLPFPPETGALWLSVLADGEAVLKGEKLVPFWRLGPGAGLDLGAILQDPPVFDVAGLVQGATLVPYLRAGPVVDGTNLQRFGALLGGDSPLYMVMLN